MLKLFSVFKYVKGYWGYAVQNIFFNILFAIFSVFSITLVIPFLDLLFTKGYSEYMGYINAYTGNGFDLFKMKDWFYHVMSKMIVQHGTTTEALLKGKTEALILICVAIFALTLLKNLCRYLAMYCLAPIRNGVVRDLRNKMLEKTLELPLSYYSDERKGDMMSRMTTDVIEIEWSIMQTLEMVFREPLIIVISLGWLIALSPYLTLYVFLLLPVAGLIVALINRTLKRNAAEGKMMLGHLFNIMEETLGGLKIIKAFTAEKYLRRKFEKVNQDYYKLSVKTYRRADLGSPVSETIVVGILMFILFIGGVMTLNNNGLTAAAFMGYFGIASQILPPIKQITQAYNNIQKGLASEDRIEKILHAENTIRNAANAYTIHDFNRAIEFKNVSFAYTKGDEGYVLKDINLSIPKGKTIALVGQSGSGKTTMADMIPRFYDTDLGELLIDGTPVKQIDIESLRKQIGIVSQESILFNDTIFNNIAFGIDNVDEKKVMEAAKVANAHEFILQQPNGYQTNIGDRGGKLSGGQRQRVSIARAILKNPPILILDEATSALDTESERLVQDALNNLMKNRTSIVIAHRLSTIVNADEIIVLSKGEIVERGNHTELIAQNGIYKKLCDMQSFKS
ncbi:MAG: ABC transporter ATP-binding protein [Bacteroidetes bacterium]|nr:ABC transporter ATP-binding protein [Bacteroidota bacterium]